ncbi:MAG: DUF3793 family protein [Clostridia bacterium]|nr:DUF3793 family protein [Clostridia bacterium]
MEAKIAYHCAPALAGIKPANIVNVPKSVSVDIHSEIEKLNGKMNVKDIFFEIIFECEKRIILMVYRRELLEKTLSEKAIKCFLCSFGYPHQVTVEGYIAFLRERLKNREFPHEIGAFLGYPIHDIQGFLYQKDEGCLLCGEWKVYKNPEKAKLLFKRFEACRSALVRRVMRGETLQQIFCAA